MDDGCKKTEHTERDTENAKQTRTPKCWENKNHRREDKPTGTIARHHVTEYEKKNSNANTISSGLSLIGGGHVAANVR